MKNQMFIPTASQLKVLEKEKFKHQKKLEEIQGQDRKTKVIEKNLAIGFKVSQTRQKNLQAIHKGKEKVIEEENELLLGKLVEISRKKAPTFTIRSESAMALKSLNAPYKKREMARISSENETFARRLISQQSTFDRKKLDVEYRKHKDLVIHMKRINATPGKNSKKLPPLKNDSQTPKLGSSLLKQSELVQSVVKDEGDTHSSKPQENTQNPATVSTVGNEEVKKTDPQLSKRNSQVGDSVEKDTRSPSVQAVGVTGNTQQNVGETKLGNQSQRNSTQELQPKADNHDEKKPEQPK